MDRERRRQDGEEVTGEGSAEALGARRRSRVDVRYGAIGKALAKRNDPSAAQAPTVNDVATAAVEEKGGGTPLDGSLRGKVEAHVGAGLGGVRVHTDPLAQQASEAIGARAFTYGKDVFVGAGESATDPTLMAHELTHVVQRAQRTSGRCNGRCRSAPPTARPRPRPTRWRRTSPAAGRRRR